MLLKTYILIGTHLAALAGGLGVGWKLRDADYQRHLKKEAVALEKAQGEARKQEAAQENTSQEVRDKVSSKQAHAEIVYRTVTKEVPVYVTRTKAEQKVVAGGGLPAGLVWAYNQSASNSPAPFPSGLDPDAPTGVNLSELASVTSGNFAVCHQYRAELEGWHSWYNQLKASWPDASKTKE